MSKKKKKPLGKNEKLQPYTESIRSKLKNHVYIYIYSHSLCDKYCICAFVSCKTWPLSKLRPINEQKTWKTSVMYRECERKEWYMGETKKVDKWGC